MKEQLEQIKAKALADLAAAADMSALDAVRAVCREEGHFEELLETQAGCTICNHCGPNTLGVLFVRKA